MEVRAQLPADTSDALLWKRIEQAKKLWKLFDAIGMDKIYRIHSFSVSSISKMTYEDIQYIIDNMSVDYSIKIESSACALLLCQKMVYQMMKKILNCHILISVQEVIRKTLSCHILILQSLK